MEKQPGKGISTLVMPVGRSTAIMADAPAAEITCGTVLLGKYILQEVLAENTGEARLYKASTGQELFAVKVYHSGNKVQDVLQEKLTHLISPLVVRALDRGWYQNRYFEILPFSCQGDLLKYAPLTEEVLLSVVVPCINEALHALHQAGIIHRDIKPSNLFFSDDRSKVIVGDFGISSVLDERSSVRMTTVSRTLGYAAPETAHGIVSTKADYYSLGITLLHLATGSDPFAGMTETQILKTTLADKLVLPAALGERLQKLIRGLTVKERTDRWGYQEIVRWLEGMEQPVIESERPFTVTPSYQFDGQEYENLDLLAMAIAKNWETGLKHFSHGFIRQHLLKFGQDLALKAAECEEAENKNFGLFRLIYLLSPGAPLCWRGAVYVDLKELGTAMDQAMPEIKEEYLELLSSSALLMFLTNKHFDQELISKVMVLQELASKEPENAYYRMFYLFSRVDKFYWKNYTFTSAEELLAFLYEYRQEFNALAAELLQHQGFWIWMEHMGFAEHIAAWEKLKTRG